MWGLSNDVEVTLGKISDLTVMFLGERDWMPKRTICIAKVEWGEGFLTFIYYSLSDFTYKIFLLDSRELHSSL